MSRIAESATIQIALGVSLALLLIGCGNGRASLPSAPSAAPEGSGNSGRPVFPVGPHVVSGTVTDVSGPIVGANVNAWVTTPRISYSYMYAHGGVVSDGAGGYRMPDVPDGAPLWFQTYKGGYVQQCAASSTIQSDVTMDLHLVAMSNLTASITQPAPPGVRWITGTIVRMTPSGNAPVAEAFVDFEPVEDFVAAVTYSDAAGRFALCGLPDSETVTLGASFGGSIGYIDVPPGQTTGVEITLR